MSHQKAIVASIIIEHTVNFALSGNSHGPCNILVPLALRPCSLHVRRFGITLTVANTCIDAGEYLYHQMGLVMHAKYNDLYWF